MKMNDLHIQTSIFNEVMKSNTTRDLADTILEVLEKKGSEVTVYETHDDGIVLRNKKEDMITDNNIIKAFAKAVKELINQDIEFEEVINDNYDFEYDDKYMSESYFATILEIRRAGRLIYIEIDLQ